MSHTNDTHHYLELTGQIEEKNGRRSGYWIEAIDLRVSKFHHLAYNY